MEAFKSWFEGLSQLVQFGIWTVAMLVAAVCCSTKARPIYQSGR